MHATKTIYSHSAIKYCIYCLRASCMIGSIKTLLDKRQIIYCVSPLQVESMWVKSPLGYNIKSVSRTYTEPFPPNAYHNVKSIHKTMLVNMMAVESKAALCWTFFYLHTLWVERLVLWSRLVFSEKDLMQFPFHFFLNSYPRSHIFLGMFSLLCYHLDYLPSYDCLSPCLHCGLLADKLSSIWKQLHKRHTKSTWERSKDTSTIPYALFWSQHRCSSNFYPVSNNSNVSAY